MVFNFLIQINWQYARIIITISHGEYDDNRSLLNSLFVGAEMRNPSLARKQHANNAAVLIGESILTELSQLKQTLLPIQKEILATPNKFELHCSINIIN